MLSSYFFFYTNQVFFKFFYASFCLRFRQHLNIFCGQGDFNYKDYDAKELCTKLYESSKLMVGFGLFREDRQHRANGSGIVDGLDVHPPQTIGRGATQSSGQRGVRTGGSELEK